MWSMCYVLYTLDLVDECHQLTEWQSVRFQISIDSFYLFFSVPSNIILGHNSRWCSFARAHYTVSIFFAEEKPTNMAREERKQVRGMPEKKPVILFSNVLINECIQFGLFSIGATDCHKTNFWKFNSTKCCHDRYVHVECFDCRICRNADRKKQTNEHTRTHAQMRACTHKLLHNINDIINFVLASLIRIDRYKRLPAFKRMHHLILIGSLPRVLFLFLKQSKKEFETHTQERNG